MSGFKVETEQAPGELRLRLFGDLDLAASDEVDEVLAGAQLNGKLDVVMDLRSLAFIDSSGVRVLLRAQARAELFGGRLHLIRGCDRVHRVFELAGIDTRFHFVDEDQSS